MHRAFSGISLPVILIPFILGCAPSDPSAFGPDAYIISGTIRYLDTEGGCWQCVSENGKSYELLPEDFPAPLNDGAYAEMIVRDSEDVSTLCMIGKIVEVLEIIRLSSLNN